jgi:hypothetical protein
MIFVFSYCSFFFLKFLLHRICASKCGEKSNRCAGVAARNSQIPNFPISENTVNRKFEKVAPHSIGSELK